MFCGTDKSGILRWSAVTDLPMSLRPSDEYTGFKKLIGWTPLSSVHLLIKRNLRRYGESVTGVPCTWPTNDIILGFGLPTSIKTLLSLESFRKTM